VPDAKQPRNPDFELERSRLKLGLKTCRMVVENYRAMFRGGPSPEQNEEPPRAL